MKALTVLAMMLAGLIVVAGIFVLRVAGLVAAVAGGFGLLAALGAYAAYSHAPTPAHWLALQQAAGFAAVCTAAVIACWFGPVWLLRENNARRPDR